MTLLTTLTLLLTIVTGLSLVLYGMLRATRHELERTRRRMDRLDEVVDEFADREFEAPGAPVLAMVDVAEAADATTVTAASDRSYEPRVRHNTPVQLDSARDSGRFESVGLQFDTGDIFDEEVEFAAPRMTPVVVDERRQKPNRPRHVTPVGSPLNFAAKPRDAVVAVGSIQLRTEELNRRSKG